MLLITTNTIMGMIKNNMKIIHILLLISFFSCSKRKKTKQLTEVEIQEQIKEKALIKSLENQYGFVNIEKENKNLAYHFDENGFVRMIIIENTEMNVLPKEIYDFSRLESLYINNNQFTDLPDSLSNFKYLDFINIAENPIIEVKNTLLPNLMKQIHFNGCVLESFPQLKKENDSIAYKLFLTKTKIDSIPDFVGDMNIKLLWVNECPITYISPRLGDCENMYGIDFSRIKTNIFPKQLAKLKKMDYIKLNRLELTEVPDFVFEWESLTAIQIDYNKISELPSGIAKLKNLKSFYAKSNDFKTLPKEFGELKNIEFIDLEYNVLDYESFPKEMFFPRSGKKPRLYVGRPNCYDCFSVPEEQVRKAFRVL